MDDLTTLPASVKYQLARAREMAGHGQHAEALLAIRDVAIALSRTHPELAAALVAASLGYGDMSVTEIDERIHESKSVREGSFGDSVRTETHKHEKTRRISFNDLEDPS